MPSTQVTSRGRASTPADPRWASPVGTAMTTCCPMNGMLPPWELPTVSRTCSTRCAKSSNTAPVSYKYRAPPGVLSRGDDPQHSQYTQAELVAIVADAHRLGRKVAAHAHGAEGILWAADAGVDSIEHASYIDYAAIASMKQHGTYLVPTLYLGDWFLENAPKSGVPPSMLAKAKEVMPAARKNIAHAFASGVKVGFGTDAAVYPHGLNAHEFAVMVKLGLTPLQAIQAATVHDADLLGWSDKVGVLEPGHYADIIAVYGDPLQDVTTLERLKFVMKGGEVYKYE